MSWGGRERHQRSLKIPLLYLPVAGESREGARSPRNCVSVHNARQLNNLRSLVVHEELRLRQMKKLDGVAADHLVFFRFRHADKVSFNNIHGVGPVGFLMRKVRAPDQAIHIDLVTQLDPDPIELESPKAMFADVLARQTVQRFET